jgi:hypothetical protein
VSRPLTPLARTARRGTALVAAAATAISGTACTPERGDSDADATVASTLAVPVVTPPPERQTPFCQIMLDLDESLPADPTIDVTNEVLEAYREALPVAPPEIADELEAIIVGLDTGTEPVVTSTIPGDIPGGEIDDEGSTETEPSTGADATTPGTFLPPTAGPVSSLAAPSPEEAFDEEGYRPDDDPAVRLAEFVDFACRDIINNPGPPPTQPSATPVPTTDE